MGTLVKILIYWKLTQLFGIASTMRKLSPYFQLFVILPLSYLSFEAQYFIFEIEILWELVNITRKRFDCYYSLFSLNIVASLNIFYFILQFWVEFTHPVTLQVGTQFVVSMNNKWKINIPNFERCSRLQVQLQSSITFEFTAVYSSRE